MVYLIDDEDSILASIEMLLQSVDMNVMTFDSGVGFLAHEPKVKNSCIVSDLQMKEMDGFSFCKTLNERGIDIPVIFLSAFDTRENRLRARKIGAVGYLSKPVDDQALLDSIQWTMSRSEVK